MAISTNDRSHVLDPTNSLSDCRAFGAGFRAHSGAGGVGDAAQGILDAVARADRRPRLRDEHLRTEQSQDSCRPARR